MSVVPRPSLTRLRRIATPGGDVLHGIKTADQGYSGFGEAYFTTVHHGVVKGWKQHKRMTLNLIVPCGSVRLMVRARNGALACSCTLSPDAEASYERLTVPPGYWLAFGGASSGLNLMCNVANHGHDPKESKIRPIDAFAWTWKDVEA